MKNRGLGKKGQEAVSNFGVTGIILIVFLVVVVLGIWYVNSSWNQVSGQIPKNAEIIAQACSVYAKESTLNSYCFDFKEADKNKYTTCDNAKNYNILILDSDGSNVSIVRMEKVCAENRILLHNSICNACNSTSGQFYENSKVEINGKKCSAWIDALKCRNVDGDSSVATIYIKDYKESTAQESEESLTYELGREDGMNDCFANLPYSPNSTDSDYVRGYEEVYSSYCGSSN